MKPIYTVNVRRVNQDLMEYNTFTDLKKATNFIRDLVKDKTAIYFIVSKANV